MATVVKKKLPFKREEPPTYPGLGRGGHLLPQVWSVGEEDRTKICRGTEPEISNN